MKTSTKKIAIETIRRGEIIEAAHRVFLRQGLAGMTTSNICSEAGMSPGILAYYFKGKDEVLFAVVRHNNRTLMEEVVAGLRAAQSAWDRLNAVIEGNFPMAAYNGETARAWLSVCAAGQRPEYGKLQTIFYSRLSSNLTSVLRLVLPKEKINQAVLSLGALIDGLWLRKAANGEVTREQAVATLIRFVECILSPQHIATLKSTRVAR